MLKFQREDRSETTPTTITTTTAAAAAAVPTIRVEQPASDDDYDDYEDDGDDDDDYDEALIGDDIANTGMLMFLMWKYTFHHGLDGSELMGSNNTPVTVARDSRTK